MCDPMTAVTVASIGTQLYGAYAEQDAENKAAEYNADVISKNIELVDIQRQQTKAIGAGREAEAAQRGTSAEAAQAASFASSGVSVGSDVANTAAKFTQSQARADAMTAKYNTSQQLKALKIERESLVLQREQELKKRQDPWIAAGTTLLTKGPQFASQFGGGGGGQQSGGGGGNA